MICACVYEIIRIGCTSTCCMWNQTSIRILPIQNPHENSITEPKRDRHCLLIVVVCDDHAVSSSSS